jgi:methionyl aminopeptidase
MLTCVHTPEEWPAIRRAGKVAAATLSYVGRRLRPGVSTADIDRWVRADTRRRGGIPSQLGYEGFPAAVCTSVNEVVCHGIPSDEVVLREGDLINVDVTTEIGGFHGDTSRTFLIGRASTEAQHLVEATREARDAGILAVRPGGRLGDIGEAIVAVARAHGCTVVSDYGGHGIGRRMHLPPHVSHVARAGTGPLIVPGMTFTIEPMLALGSPKVVLGADGWTVRTADGSLSAQFEHTVLVTDAGIEVVTR